MKAIILSAPLFCRTDFDTSPGVSANKQDQDQYNTPHACKIPNKKI
jgi:hypothetical protein